MQNTGHNSITVGQSQSQYSERHGPQPEYSPKHFSQSKSYEEIKGRAGDSFGGRDSYTHRSHSHSRQSLSLGNRSNHNQTHSLEGANSHHSSQGHEHHHRHAHSLWDSHHNERHHHNAHDHDHVHHHDHHPPQLLYMIPRGVLLQYGPYTFHGVCDFRVERLQGIEKALQKMGAKVKMVPNTDYVNRVHLWYMDAVIFSCKLTDLYHGGDGELDPNCTNAARAFDHAARKSIHGLRTRIQLTEPDTFHADPHSSYHSSIKKDEDDHQKEDSIKSDDDKLKKDDSSKGNLKPKKGMELRGEDEEDEDDDEEETSGELEWNEDVGAYVVYHNEPPPEDQLVDSESPDDIQPQFPDE